MLLGQKWGQAWGPNPSSMMSDSVSRSSCAFSVLEDVGGVCRGEAAVLSLFLSATPQASLPTRPLATASYLGAGELETKIMNQKRTSPLSSGCWVLHPSDGKVTMTDVGRVEKKLSLRMNSPVWCLRSGIR